MPSRRAQSFDHPSSQLSRILIGAFGAQGKDQAGIVRSHHEAPGDFGEPKEEIGHQGDHIGVLQES